VPCAKLTPRKTPIPQPKKPPVRTNTQ
jgi:hypothetical protein